MAQYKRKSYHKKGLKILSAAVLLCLAALSASPVPASGGTSRAGFPVPAVVLIVIAAAVIILVIVLVYLKNKKEEERENAESARMIRDNYAGASGRTARQTGSQKQAAGYPPQNAKPAGNPQNPSGRAPQYSKEDILGDSGETVQMDEESDETMLLDQGHAVQAYLIRRRTGEKVMICTPVFTLGKQKQKVDYWIRDNTAVSRQHAVITRADEEFCIADQHSTNRTYVNGVQAEPGAQVPLTNHCIIKLADEEFEFYTE